MRALRGKENFDLWHGQRAENARAADLQLSAYLVGLVEQYARLASRHGREAQDGDYEWFKRRLRIECTDSAVYERCVALYCKLTKT